MSGRIDHQAYWHISARQKGQVFGHAIGNGSDGDDPARRGSTDLLTRTKPKPKKPSLYQVMILNDDYTPMEFVIYVLEKFFGKNREEATQIMLHIHTNGKGRCGVYSFEIAETKVMQVMRTAEQEHHPLQCTMEKV